MSSRRDSAFSDSAAHLYTNQNPYRRVNSDCQMSNSPNIYPNRLVHSMEQLPRQMQQNTIEQLSIFSNNGSKCSCHDSYPADPGGTNRILQPLTTNHSFTPPPKNCSIESTNSQKKSSEPPKPQRLLQLCSQRLLPKTHKTENSILHILEDGEVVVELMKRKGKLKRQLVCEVLRISSDGGRIVLYEPNGGKGVVPGDKPPPLPGGFDVFTIENLPEKHWNKYMHAYQFVALIKEKTPKVTCYNDKMKFVLMENLTDFEATFYEGLYSG